MVGRRVAAIALGCLLAVACLSPIDVTGRACLDGACPTGLVCVENACVKPESADAGRFVPPYALPAPGESVEIGVNTMIDTRPSGVSGGRWVEAMLDAWSGGVFVADYSPGGAFVFASVGAGDHPPIFGAVLFDFTDATWKRLDVDGLAAQSNAITAADANADFELTLHNAPPQVPAPTQHYLVGPLAIPRALDGGARGSVLIPMRPGVFPTFVPSYLSHRFDLETRRWSRAASNRVTDVAVSDNYKFNASSALDEATGRVYVLPNQAHVDRSLLYLDLASATWKTTASFPSIAMSPGLTQPAFVLQRSLFSIDSEGVLRAYSLDRPSNGAVEVMVNGALPRARVRWVERKGKLFTFIGTGSTLSRLTPQSDLRQPWTVDSLPVGGAGLPAATATSQSHFSRFVYVSALDVFAWIPGDTQVVLIRPGADW